MGQRKKKGETKGKEVWVTKLWFFAFSPFVFFSFSPIFYLSAFLQLLLSLLGFGALGIGVDQLLQGVLIIAFLIQVLI